MAKPSPKQRSHRRYTLAFALACLAVLSACGPRNAQPLQGYVEGEYVRVAAPFAGTLQQLSVQRGGEVAAGAPLFTLERENELAGRRQAEQQLQAASARLANLQTGKRPPEVEMVTEQLRQAVAARELSEANLKRQESLFKSGFISGAAVDDVRTKLKNDDARVQELKATVETAKMPARPAEIRAAEADADAARQALAQADWKLGQRAVTAPASGHVSDTYFVVGDWVPAGAVVANLLPPGNVKIRFFVTEPQLGAVHPGQVVRFSCDGCGDAANATINFIADRAEFTPPVLYSKENRAKLVYLVEARPDPGVAARLNPGQPLDITLFGG
jgi:HlyD family secretion protein